MTLRAGQARRHLRRGDRRRVAGRYAVEMRQGEACGAQRGQIQEDEAVARKVTSKNGFENYCFQMKNTLDDEKLKEHFTDDDKKLIAETSAEGLQWLEGNADADAEVIEGKQKELEAKYNPIMMRVYQASGGAPGAGGMPGMPGGMGGMPGGMPGGMGGMPGGMPGAGGAGDAGVDDLD